jgi:hypothetical protein
LRANSQATILLALSNFVAITQARSPGTRAFNPEGKHHIVWLCLGMNDDKLSIQLLIELLTALSCAWVVATHQLLHQNIVSKDTQIGGFGK